MRRVFYDCEFIEDGRTIDLISIGMIDDRGYEFYAISTEFDESKASDWVRENVLAQLDSRTEPVWMSRTEIRNAVYSYLTRVHDDVELWAYFGAYDHVALAQLFGSMMDLPDGVPMFTHELMQLWERAGQPEKPKQTAEHDALADAHWNREVWQLCMERVR